jgi:hypothetical protein
MTACPRCQTVGLCKCPAMSASEPVSAAQRHAADASELAAKSAEAREQATRWQPIETAPKAQRVLVCVELSDMVDSGDELLDGGYVCIAEWLLWSNGTPKGEQNGWKSCGRYLPAHHIPTGWKALPAAGAAAARKGEPVKPLHTVTVTGDEYDRLIADAYARGREAVYAEIRKALLNPPSDHHESLHQRVERECWKQHPENFGVCQQPACVLLKRIAVTLGWAVGTNGVVAASVPSPGAGEK